MTEEEPSAPGELRELQKGFGDFTPINQATKEGLEEVALQGWIYRIRSSNKMAFLVLRDGTGIVQCVIKKDALPDDFESIRELGVESSVIVRGKLHEDDRAPGGYEVQVEKIRVVQAAAPFPIAKDHSPEFLLDQRHLWLRSRKLAAVMRIRHTLLGAMNSFFRERGFIEFSPPIFTPNACEGGSTLFNVKYFQDTVYLTQSWQLYAEAAIFSLGKIYCISPTFRAEKSKTSRHLAEFWMHEMEGAWLDLDGCVDIGKKEVQFLVKEVLEKNAEDLKILKRDVDLLRPTVEQDLPSITYTEALKILKDKEGIEVPWGKDLRTIEEDRLMKHFKTPIVVTDYPKEAMAFYKPVKKDAKAPGKVALCFDMLAPEGYGEIIGGSQRELDISELTKYLEEEGEDPQMYDWYLDTRRYGSVPHAGYGMGVERVLAWICGLDNIKDAIPFPRTMLRKKP